MALAGLVILRLGQAYLILWTEWRPEIYERISGEITWQIFRLWGSSLWIFYLQTFCNRFVPKVMSNNFLHANWKQQTKETSFVDGTSCCIILDCLVTSIACITWPVSLLTKWLTWICRFASVLSSKFLWKRKSLLQKFTRDFSVLMEVCSWVRAVFEVGWNILKVTKPKTLYQSQRWHCIRRFGLYWLVS